ncbi:8882_t:CDS:2, partial [Rhizophagus irregularis]
MMMGNKYKPDIGFYNHDSDHKFALEKLTVIQQNNLIIEYIGIILFNSQ